MNAYNRPNLPIKKIRERIEPIRGVVCGQRGVLSETERRSLLSPGTRIASLFFCWFHRVFIASLFFCFFLRVFIASLSISSPPFQYLRDERLIARFFTGLQVFFSPFPFSVSQYHLFFCLERENVKHPDEKKSVGFSFLIATFFFFKRVFL